MKKTFIWLLASLLFTMVGCVEGLHESGMTETSSEQLPDLTAGFAEGETRTYVESGKYLRWHEDDRLTAFYGNTLNRQYKFNGATGDNSGSFSYVSSGNLETGNALDRIYAVYPYDETATITDDGQISLTLPAVQTYAENSFGRGANTMLAVTENLEDTFLPFKNVCGYLKLKLYNAEGATIKSIKVQGNGEENIAGAATATITFGEVPQLTMADDATTAITLDCGDGVALGTTSEAATEFWVVIPETTFESGITITVTDTEGGIFEKSTTKEVVIERNAVQPMAALGVEFVAPVVKPANNEIWYTNGSTTKATTPYKTDVFGANIVSNTYDAEKECWVITFDGEVTTIGDKAFYWMNLASIAIPDSVTAIGSNAFSQCSKLTDISIGDSVTTIGDYAFSGCSRLTSITIPNSVTSIGKGAFKNCGSLTSVTIGDGVTAIGDEFFYYCSDLTSVTIGDSVTTIGNSAFYSCGSLTSVTIPDSVTTIGHDAFRFCTNLTSATIGDNVTTIGDYAFGMCSNLQEFKGTLASEDGRCLIIEGVLESFAPAGITEYTIPDGVIAIGDTVFSTSKSLTSVTIPDSVTTIGNDAFVQCNNLTSVTIGNGVTTIGDSAFSGCSSLTSVTIGDSVTTIGNSAFYNCSSLTSVTIPDSVTSIEFYAFYNCSGLTNVTIGNGVTTIGSLAFRYCTNLTNIYITDLVAWCNISFEDSDSNPLCNGGGNLYINNEAVADLTIPDSVTTIGSYTFYNCSGLSSVTIGNGVTTIGNSAFNGCSSLTSVTIPDSVTTIRGSAFYGCSSLTSVTMPDSVTTIGGSAFSGCSSLTSVTIPDSVTTIESGTFRGCSGLTSVTIPNGVTTIDVYAFRDCSSLTSITIPNSVTEVGDRAFTDCSNLTSVYCNPTTPPAGTPYMFQYNASDLKIYVPAESVSAYKSASGWSEYKSYIVGYDL